MFRLQIDKIPGVFALVSVLALGSCSGGSSVTAGVGGSGIGGTGVTLVRGNVVTVVAALEGGAQVRMLANIVDLFSRPVIAQSGGVGGIAVSGGGQADITDEQGRFELIGVTPSPDFVLTLAVTSGQLVNLGIGPVPENSAVQVNNIVVDARQGSATTSSIEVKDNSASSSDDDDSGNGGSGDPEDDNSESSDPGDEDDGDSGNSGPDDSEDDGDSKDDGDSEDSDPGDSDDGD